MARKRSFAGILYYPLLPPTDMRRLIINADDLGINAPRSHGIFQCAEFGVVRSATLICNGSDADRAAKHAREKGLPTGLHLNLTDGPPLCGSGEVASLLEGTGDFLDRDKQRRALDEETVDRVHIEREIRAQVEWFLDNHGQPTHLDGHHHIHTHPAVVPLLIPILDRYAIGFVRIPKEDPLPPYGYVIGDQQLQTVRQLAAEAEAARTLFVANGIRSTDHFRGATLCGNASMKNLRHILTRLPEGTTELMVHPGSMTPIGSPFDLDPQRQTELAMMMNPELPALLQERKIELISYADL